MRVVVVEDGEGGEDAVDVGDLEGESEDEEGEAVGGLVLGEDEETDDCSCDEASPETDFSDLFAIVPPTAPPMIAPSRISPAKTASMINTLLLTPHILLSSAASLPTGAPAAAPAAAPAGRDSHGGVVPAGVSGDQACGSARSSCPFIVPSSNSLGASS